jgi:hypothetical protein
MIRRESVANLSGTGLLADDLYLLAHHDVSGKPLLQPRAVGLGLAGALLAELMLTGNIRVTPAAVGVTDRVPPQDDLARSVLGRLLSEREVHQARAWLLFLGRTAAGEVARRLARSGYLVQAPGRRRARAARWVPVDADCAFAPLVRVKAALRAPEPGAVHGVALAGLADACGLGMRLESYMPPYALGALGDAVRALAPDLRELIAQVQAAVESAVLAARM